MMRESYIKWDRTVLVERFLVGKGTVVCARHTLEGSELASWKKE